MADRCRVDCSECGKELWLPALYHGVREDGRPRWLCSPCFKKAAGLVDENSARQLAADRICVVRAPLVCCFRDDEYGCCRAPVNGGPHPLFCEGRGSDFQQGQQHCPLDDGPIQIQKEDPLYVVAEAFDEGEVSVAYEYNDVFEPTCNGGWWRRRGSAEPTLEQIEMRDVWRWQAPRGDWVRCRFTGVTWTGPIPIPNHSSIHVTFGDAARDPLAPKDDADVAFAKRFLAVAEKTGPIDLPGIRAPSAKDNCKLGRFILGRLGLDIDSEALEMFGAAVRAKVEEI